MAFNVWASVLYSFVQENNLVAAKFIEQHIRTLHVYGVKMDMDLRPLCETKLLQRFPECMYFVAKLIRCGCNFTNLSTPEKDTFINAGVRMTFLTGKCFLKNVCFGFICNFLPEVIKTSRIQDFLMYKCKIIFFFLVFLN